MRSRDASRESSPVLVLKSWPCTPKGGALFGVARELELPILYIGMGETMYDLVKFDPHDFVDTIVDEIYA